MNVAEIKAWLKETEGKGDIARRDHVEWLVAEVDRVYDQTGRTLFEEIEALTRQVAQLRENPLVTWEEGESFQVNGVTVRAAVDPAVGGAELYTPCVPVSMIGKRGIVRFTVAEDVPPGEVHFRNQGGELAAGPEGSVGHVPGGVFQTQDGEAAAHANDGEWLQPSTNPFGHGCCDCGLYHDVAFRIADAEGNGVEMAPGHSLQLSFTRNATETARLRAHQGRG